MRLFPALALIPAVAACREPTRTETPVPAPVSVPVVPRESPKVAAPAKPSESPKVAAPAKPSESPKVTAPAKPPERVSELPVSTSPSRAWTQAELERVSDEIKADIEAMRGMKFERPVKVKVTDKKGFLDYAHERQALTMTPERLARDETVAKMLGLIPPDMDLLAAVERLLEEQVGGFYDPSSDTFYLMESFTGDIAKIILAHELTHALDDQHFDLDGNLKKLREETDAEFAFQAVVEGSGVAAMNQWTFMHLAGLDKKELLDSQDVGTQGLEDAPALIWKPLLAAYLRGEGFLVRSEGLNVWMKAAKVEDIRRAFTDPPRSSEQILHPQKYWDEKKRDEPRRIEFDTSKLPEGWKVLGEDTLGEITLALLTAPPEERKGLDVSNPMAMLGIKYTNKAAEGWGGDRLILLGKGDARFLQLVTLWDTPEDTSEFLNAVGEADAAGDLGVSSPVIVERLSGSSEASPDWVMITRRLGQPTGDALPPLPWKEVAAEEAPR